MGTSGDSWLDFKWLSLAFARCELKTLERAVLPVMSGVVLVLEPAGSGGEAEGQGVVRFTGSLHVPRCYSR